MVGLEQVWKNTFRDTFSYTVEEDGSLNVPIAQGHPMRLSDFTFLLRQIMAYTGRKIRTEILYDDDGAYMHISLEFYVPVDPAVVEPIDSSAQDAIEDTPIQDDVTPIEAEQVTQKKRKPKKSEVE